MASWLLQYRVDIQILVESVNVIKFFFYLFNDKSIRCIGKQKSSSLSLGLWTSIWQNLLKTKNVCSIMDFITFNTNTDIYVWTYENSIIVLVKIFVKHNIFIFFYFAPEYKTLQKDAVLIDKVNRNLRFWSYYKQHFSIAAVVVL